MASPNTEVHDVTIAYIYDGTTNNQPPSKNDGYVLTNISCTNATGEWDDVNWTLKISNLTDIVTCNLTFDDTTNYQIIEYNPNGGYLAEQYIKGTIGQQIGTLPTTIKSGYTFEGWYTASSGGTQVTSTTNVTSLLSTLYARYSENTITISNNTNSIDVENYKYAIVNVSAGSLTETTLWTNPNPTASFSSQAVQLSHPYTDYKRIRFYYMGYGSTVDQEY